MVAGKRWSRERRVLAEFVAGAAATIFFHQPALWLLHVAGVTSRGPYSMNPVPPFDVPSVISLAFWGGVWGIVLIPAIASIKRDGAYWIAALLFGAIVPTLVAWFVVAPLKGMPMAGGWKTASMVTGLIANGMWGVGTALIFRLLSGSR